MKRRLKLKINGDSPISLFIAFVLAKLKCDVYLYDFLINSNSKKDNQIFLFSNFSKRLFSEFEIWNEIEDISYGFTSLIIKDNLVSDQLLLRTEDLSKKQLNTIGWTANYSDIKHLLLNKLITYDNVYFISKDQSIDETLIFDYEFNFKNYDNILNLFKLPFSFLKGLDEQVFIFNVYLRGHVEKRLYEINTNKGLLVLTPLNKNLYQIIWKTTSFQIRKKSLMSKSFFLDNLTTLLPNELRIDQIIGDINFLYINNIYSTYLIRNKSIYFNENKLKSNTLFYLNFDIIIKKILLIYNFLENKDNIYIKILNKFGFYFLINKYIEIMINYSFFNLLFYLLRENNLFSLCLRKLLFILPKKTNLLKIFFISNLNKLNINYLIK